MNVIALPAVLEKTSLSRATIYRLIQKGHFPAPRKIGTISFWDEDAVDRRLENLPSGVTGESEFPEESYRMIGPLIPPGPLDLSHRLSVIRY